MINIASLKAHACAGITLCAKNHFGSHTRNGAGHLHAGLIGSTNDIVDNGGYRKYRVQVDLIGNKYLGANTLLFMVDGLYSGQEGYSAANSIKWRMAPFNNDYPSSIFMSQDNVALESVCMDFLWTEYDGTGGRTNRPHYDGVDDYLHQAADKANWPADITYAPNGDDVAIGSLGVHEHWNNPVDKQYSKNLSSEGPGIELVSPLVKSIKTSSEKPQLNAEILKVYPNPLVNYALINYTVKSPATVKVEIFNLNGQLVSCVSNSFQQTGSYTVKWDLTSSNENITSGMYLCKTTFSGEQGTSVLTRKINVTR
jgi:hypothetical protein